MAFRPARLRAAAALLAALPSACGDAPWNDPYPAGEASADTFYTYFLERPKHLDPAVAYSQDEYEFIAQIYEPPVQYHFLERPYEPVPLAAVEVPTPAYLDKDGHPLPPDAPEDAVAFSEYVVRIRPGMRYEPHPCFAKDDAGRPWCDTVSERDLVGVTSPADLRRTGTREVEAADFVYEIKRLAHPRLQSPILGLMSDYIVGLKEYGNAARKAWAEAKSAQGAVAFLDLTRMPLEGAEVVDRTTYKVRIRGKYPQFVYWLAMPFFSPVPPEADRFFSRPGMSARNFSLDEWPIGSGPFRLAENDPNRRIVLDRNPNFHGEAYPSEGEPGDAERGLLADAGRPLPLADTIVFSLEKESIPHWNKFLQGYYDVSGVHAEAFDQAVHLSVRGDAELSDDMQAQGIRMNTAVRTSLWYLGFNMMDPVVGGADERARKLRQAVSIALDFEEFVGIFRNGRGIPAHGPIPPGIFGYEEGPEGINRVVYDVVDGKPRRKSIDEARRLLAEAGYPDGREAATGKPLILYYDSTDRGPEDRKVVDWLVKQIQKLGVQMVARITDYNRFQDKMQKGGAQIFMWGWNADYPDPENFLFLLYGPNAKVKTQGENASNYENPEYDALFRRMKDMPNTPERTALIRQMVDILRRDAPWAFGYYPKDYILYHAWYGNAKPNVMANNHLKYKRIDGALRARLRAERNRPVRWPLPALAVLLAAVAIPAVVSWRRRERQVAR